MRKALLAGGLALWTLQGAAAAQTKPVDEEERMDAAFRKFGYVSVRRERREAVREIANADSPWEARQEIREAHREVNREIREKRREVRREVNQSYWGW